MNKIKVKHFTWNNSKKYYSLENQINDFFNNNDIEIIDIKYAESSFGITGAYASASCFHSSALLLYKEKDNTVK